MLQLLCLFAILLLNPVESLIQPRHRCRQRRRSFVVSATSNPEVGDNNPTSLLFLLSYDGGRFTGWSAANTGANQTGFVRSVEDVLRQNLARLFGDVDSSRLIVEGTSRTDKGVHAKTMVAQAYCLSQDWESISVPSSIPGKRRPHPKSSFDNDCFVPFPMSPSRILAVLNRMLPDDISVRGVCPSPFQEDRPFHPTLDSEMKTYQYTFSVGPIHDPSQWRRTWHIGSKFETSDLDFACAMLQGTHDFRAFRGAPRGKDDRRKKNEESTVCTLFDACVELDTSSCPIPDLKTYRVSVTGDRFLYKMVRFLVGSLVDIGLGTLNPEDLDRALESGSFDPQPKPSCAPANGLVLADVAYKPELSWLN
jgi:tRNA pseudouridine38-40 synthase